MIFYYKIIKVNQEKFIGEIIMGITIYDMDFSVRTYNCLRRSSINTKQELERWTKEELLTLRNMHIRQLNEILERKDVKLKEII